MLIFCWVFSSDHKPKAPPNLNTHPGARTQLDSIKVPVNGCSWRFLQRQSPVKLPQSSWSWNEHPDSPYDKRHDRICLFKEADMEGTQRTKFLQMLYTSTNPPTHTVTHKRTIYVSFESGLLMERPPLINASFNDSPVGTGGRVIVCFSSSPTGKKWNDVQIYEGGSPGRQNY